MNLGFGGLAGGRRSGERNTGGSAREDRPDVRELALEGCVLCVEELVGHVGRLEHDEAEGGAAIGQANRRPGRA